MSGPWSSGSARSPATSIRISTPSRPIPVSATAGVMADHVRGFSRLWRSLTLRAAVVVGLFIALPFLLYVTFRQADVDRQQLLLQSKIGRASCRERVCQDG